MTSKSIEIFKEMSELILANKMNGERVEDFVLRRDPYNDYLHVFMDRLQPLHITVQNVIAYATLRNREGLIATRSLAFNRANHAAALLDEYRKSYKLADKHNITYSLKALQNEIALHTIMRDMWSAVVVMVNEDLEIINA
jgi:hypothetical protein